MVVQCAEKLQDDERQLFQIEPILKTATINFIHESYYSASIVFTTVVSIFPIHKVFRLVLFQPLCSLFNLPIPISTEAQICA